MNGEPEKTQEIVRAHAEIEGLDIVKFFVGQKI